MIAALKAQCLGNRLADLTERFQRTRNASVGLAEPLTPEDCVMQSMPDASPTLWHLAHVTWFFETFLLEGRPGYETSHPQFRYMFNSYYNGVGDQFPRPRRGCLSRPGLSEVLAYRSRVDEQLLKVLSQLDLERDANLLDRVELGIHHEQQHQELILTDIKHALGCNPLFPAYQLKAIAANEGQASPLEWIEHSGGLEEIGHCGVGFAFDNESSRHATYLQPFALANRLTTNAEYLEFMAEGGYKRPEFWLSAGWKMVVGEGWKAPHHWHEVDGSWRHFTLGGLRPLNPLEPVCHLSYFEADAFARWSGHRLPTEFEWEAACWKWSGQEGNFVESGRFHPAPVSPLGLRRVSDQPSLRQMLGDVWEWTSSSYGPYPGFKTATGALGEYNGKFMCNQYVLRGGSCATPESHIRPSYRNFFQPEARWQFSGLRLARDLD